MCYCAALSAVFDRICALNVFIILLLSINAEQSLFLRGGRGEDCSSRSQTICGLTLERFCICLSGWQRLYVLVNFVVVVVVVVRLFVCFTKPVWIDKSISLSSKIRLMRSLVTSIFLYACESWTLTAELHRKIQAMEMRCYRKILHISYKDHVTNEEVRAKIQQAIGPHENLLTVVKRRKLQWYGHVSRSSGLAKTILQDTVKGGRRQGRQRKRWEDNIREQTGLEFGKSQRAVENRAN